MSIASDKTNGSLPDASREGALSLSLHNNHYVCNMFLTRSPAGAGIANRPLVFLGIFLIFGSNTPIWSVENQLNY